MIQNSSVQYFIPMPQPLPKPTVQKPGPGRPKDPEKRQAVLDAAKRLFPQHGFDGVSMEAIAAEAGVSKLTVYSHYGDKAALFTATIRAKCEEMLPPTLFQSAAKGPIRRQLTSIARAFFALVTSEEAIGMQRVMSTLMDTDSRLPQMFWEAGPQRVHDGFADFLRSRIAAGQLEIPDVDRASSQFFCLLKGELHARMVCGCPGNFGEQEVDAHIKATVDLFLRAYSPATANKPDATA
jgi:TetR/AcrR family transcriptional repressor of mexJK operon